MKGKWHQLTLFFFLWSELFFFFFYDRSWSESSFIFSLLFYSIRVDLSWSDPDGRLIRSDFCTCLAKMFVCPEPKISHVMMKGCRRASHLGRFTLWNNGHRRASHLGRFTLWNNGHRATQLGRFTLWHYCRLATQLSRFTLWHKTRWASQLAGKFTLWQIERRPKQPCLMHAPGVTRVFQRKK